MEELSRLPDVKNAEAAFLEKKGCRLKAVPDSIGMDEYYPYVGGLLSCHQRWDLHNARGCEHWSLLRGFP